MTNATFGTELKCRTFGAEDSVGLFTTPLRDVAIKCRPFGAADVAISDGKETDHRQHLEVGKAGLPRSLLAASQAFLVTISNL